MKYGFIITTFNDAEQAVGMFKSLKESIPVGESYGVVVVDGGSSEEQKNLIQSEIGSIVGVHKDLSSALNIGYKTLLDFDMDYMLWIHTDCRYHQSNWARKLINIYEEINPLVARLSPGTSNIDSSIMSLQNGEALREANNCPTLMSADIVREIINKDGYLYDPEFVGIGGCEDIDLWHRMKRMGYLSCICSLVDCWHHGAGIRFTEGRDTREDQIKNRELYHRKWDNGVWNDQLGPICKFDLSEINKNLITKFSNLKDEVINLIPERNKISEEMKGKFYSREYNK